MKKSTFVALCGLLLPMVACSSGRQVNTMPMPSLDVPSYLGAWYEIARIDHYFEKGMTNTMAYYEANTDGTLRILNSGWKNDRYKTSEGKAKLTDTPALLRVSFFGPFYSDYRVLWISDQYHLSLVGGASADYLWILSRTPTITNEEKQALLTEARRRGYDTEQLVWVDQTENINNW